ncbi:unnamed protein product, partial [Mesorhabditis spiculigera]
MPDEASCSNIPDMLNLFNLPPVEAEEDGEDHDEAPKRRSHPRAAKRGADSSPEKDSPKKPTKHRTEEKSPSSKSTNRAGSQEGVDDDEAITGGHLDWGQIFETGTTEERTARQARLSDAGRSPRESGPRQFRPDKCKVCQFQYKGSAANIWNGLSQHVWTHMDEKRYVCTKGCGFQSGKPTNHTCSALTAAEKKKHGPYGDYKDVLSRKLFGKYLSQLDICFPRSATQLHAFVQRQLQSFKFKEESPNKPEAHPKKPSKKDGQSKTCQVCHKVLTSRMAAYQLIHHALNHMKVKPWSCPDCDVTSRTKWPITTHIQREHKGVGEPVDSRTDDYFREAEELAIKCFPHHVLAIQASMAAQRTSNDDEKEEEDEGRNGSDEEEEEVEEQEDEVQEKKKPEKKKEDEVDAATSAAILEAMYGGPDSPPPRRQLRARKPAAPPPPPIEEPKGRRASGRVKDQHAKSVNRKALTAEYNELRQLLREKDMQLASMRQRLENEELAQVDLLNGNVELEDQIKKLDVKQEDLYQLLGNKSSEIMGLEMQTENLRTALEKVAPEIAARMG